MMESNLMKKTGWIHILFFISMNAMSLMFAFRYGTLMMLIHIFMSIIVSYWLIFKKRILEEIILKDLKFNSIYICMCTILQTCVISFVNVKKFYSMLFVVFSKILFLSKLSDNLQEILAITISSVIFLFACFSIFIFAYAFNKKVLQIINKEKNKLDKTERTYLKFVSSAMIFIVLILFSVTNVFYLPTQNGNKEDYDVIYTCDTGNHFTENVWINISSPENDIRQPLFAVFSMPFTAIIFLISKLLFFIPNMYAVLLAVIQIILLEYMYIMISRLLKLDGKEKFLFLILSTFTYPFLLFALNLEQYIFATFWLLMLIYSVLTDRDNINYLYIAATGSMLTSGIFFPFLSEAKKIKGWAREILKVATDFMAITVLSGQFIVFVLLTSSLEALSRFSGVGLSLFDRILQFLNFVGSCIIAPKTIIDYSTYGHVSLQLAPVSFANMFGIIVLIGVVLGYILNRKEKFAQISAIWVLFSFIILVIVGWGTKENGLILYSLYFSWAYISLIIMFLKKILPKEKVRNFVYLFIISAFAIINVPALYEFVKFGIEYYPIG